MNLAELNTFQKNIYQTMNNIFTKVAKITQDEVGPEVNESMLVGGTAGSAATSAGSLLNQYRKAKVDVPNVKTRRTVAEHGNRKVLLDLLDSIRETDLPRVSKRQAAKMGLLGLAGGTLTGAIASTLKTNE